MKRFLASLILITSSVLPFAALAAGSATLVFSQPSIDVVAGKMFDLSVNVVPNGESLDTVRAVVAFDPAILQAEAISLTGTFNRNIPGNFIDNNTGKISWGAFTLEGPVNTTGAFAKITFVGRKTGKTTLTLTPDSHLISGGEEKGDTTKFGTTAVAVSEAKPAEPGLSVITVSSSTHQEEIIWYPKSAVQIGWVGENGNSEITNYRTAFDQTSDTDPTTSVASSQTTATYKDVKDGVHYFHIKGMQKNGKVTQTVHRRINVDTTKPNPFEVTISSEQLLEGESLWLNFATTDDTSGIAQYQVALNDSAFQTQTSPVEITDLKKGTYFARVAAVDYAGNVVYQGKSVRVYPQGTKIDRPEGYQENAEAGVIDASVQSEKISTTSKQNLLITFVLVVVVASGIIYATKFRKK
ncbi:MAG: cohesin domain-containing protein [Patescibacteria group bacterium]